MPIPLTDPADPRVEDYFGLTDVALRRRLEPERGLYMAESEKVIRRALAAGHVPRSMLLTPRWVEDLAELVAEVEASGAPVYVAEPAVAESMTGFHLHRGALAAMQRPELPTVADLLHDAVEILGAQRHAAICRELTKTYEEVHRGTLAQLCDWVEQGVRGEITLVLAGATAQTVSLADAVEMVDEVVADGEKTSRAVAGIAARTGLRRRELYDAFLAARRAGAGAGQSEEEHSEAPDQPSAE